jgi:hypothetical protein
MFYTIMRNNLFYFLTIKHMKNISKQEGQLIHHFNENNQPCFTNLQARQAFPYLSKNSVNKLLNSMIH